MTEQQGTPDQLPAEKDRGGAGATYKVLFFFFPEIKVIIKNMIDSNAPQCLQLAIFEFENFRGKKVELSGECKDVLEKAQRVGSVIVESGP